MTSPVEQVTARWGWALTATVARTADAGSGVGVVLVAAAGGNGLGLGGLLAAALTAPHLFGTRIGGLVDRARDPRRPLAAGCVGYALALAAATGALRLGLPVAAGGALVVAGACGPLLTGGFSALTGGLGGSPERARGLDTLTYGVSGVAGPAAVAGLATLTSPASSLLTLAGATVVAALGTRWLPPVRVGEPAPVPGGLGVPGVDCRWGMRRADAFGVPIVRPRVRRSPCGAADGAAAAAGHGHHGRDRRGRRDARGFRRRARRVRHRPSRRRRVAARGDGAGQPRRIRGTGRAPAHRRARPGVPPRHGRPRRGLPARRAGFRVRVAARGIRGGGRADRPVGHRVAGHARAARAARQARGGVRGHGGLEGGRRLRGNGTRRAAGGRTRAGRGGGGRRSGARQRARDGA